ncbi:major histocompatibility complex class I-related protein [Labeo rohita]|uniref:Major histocompatibility complex class I-related protein n=1 Tax=Labeo rohita TaxID=84645 RepID=A0A498LV50_LABRO|nr:major histocompatibility complex class I-related protein [Labeo rohita]
MVDDLQIGYYDSITWKAVYRSHSDPKYYDEEQSDAGVVFRHMYNSVKDRAFYLKNLQNDTDVLRRYLDIEKNNVMRKVKPRVRLMRKMLTDSQGLQIICLATGFYPRHINLTLFRDDQPVDDDQITGGEILPNGDGTYQMRKSLMISKEELREQHKYNCTIKHLNLDNKLDITFGVHVSQRLAGCELLNNGNPGPLHFWDAFDGQNIGEFNFDTEKNEIEVKPRVRLMRKTLPDSQGLQISCLATGFYPRHINLTLFRDGQPVDDDQITGGEILPNGDATYQMRKTLVISEEELREGHKYNCTMKHLNMDNKLDITFDVAESDPGFFSQSVVVSVLVFMCVAVLIITALIIWRKRCAADFT